MKKLALAVALALAVIGGAVAVSALTTTPAAADCPSSSC
jgi:hypothetical protein